MATEKLLAKNKERLETQVVDLDSKIKASIKMNRDDIASAYIGQLQQAQLDLQRTGHQFEHAQLASKQALKARDNYVLQMQRRTSEAMQLINQSKQAKLQEQLAQTMASFQLGDDASTFEEMRDKIDRRAAAAEAGRPVDRFEPAMQIQVALGASRSQVLEQLLKVKPVGAMALLMPGAVWKKVGLRHPLGEGYEGFADIIPNEVPPQAFAEAERQVRPELLNEAIFAGSVDEVVEEVKPYVGAGMKHVVMWNIGPLATGGGAGDLVRQTQLIRRLKKLETNGA